jgi:predicted ferric reductase
MTDVIPEENAQEKVDDVMEESAEEVLAVQVVESKPQVSIPRVTFRGNSYDLMSLAALMTGGLVLLSCLTCNMGYYCLPLVPIGLGLVGLLGAHQSVNTRRTRLWSWLGIGFGGLLLVLILVAIALYVALIVFLIAIGELE